MSEKSIEINLFDDYYIRSMPMEFQLAKKTIKVDDDGKEIENFNVYGHYGSISQLLKFLPDTYLKKESNAKTVEDLVSDVKYIKDVIEKFIEKFNI